MMFKLDLKQKQKQNKTKTLNALRPSEQSGLMQKRQFILRRKTPLACILRTHQKSYKLGEGIVLIFVSEKNRPLFSTMIMQMAHTWLYFVVFCIDQFYQNPLGLLQYHWNKNVVILTKFSSLATLEVVKMTTSSVASDENFVKMTTFLFQWWH